jgi:hypothetical protein
MTDTLYAIWLLVWQFPQWLLGRILLWANRSEIVRRIHIDRFTVLYEMRDGFRKGKREGIALGFHILLDQRRSFLVTACHEYGHCIQSRRWGWFYLPVVGIASILRAIYWEQAVLPASEYYRSWPESEADRLGGVNPDRWTVNPGTFGRERDLEIYYPLTDDPSYRLYLADWIAKQITTALDRNPTNGEILARYLNTVKH